METESEKTVNELPPTTVPPTFPISISGFETVEHAKKFSNLLGDYVIELGRYIDLGTLDGITVAADYERALRELDRGYVTNHDLSPTTEFAFGIAMTPSVIRDGKIKSHIVINANVLLPLESPEKEGFGLALQTLAHECAHVEVTNKFDSVFPNIILKPSYPDARSHLRGEVIHACWDEFAATMISAPFGEDPTAAFEETFETALLNTGPKANTQVKQYRLHGNHSQIAVEVYGTYGNLMKYAAYLLGTMAGKEQTLDALQRTKDNLRDHWFAPFFHRLRVACDEIKVDYGKWRDMSKFECVGDILEDLLASRGIHISKMRDGSFNISIPFSPETMPSSRNVR